RALGMGLNPTTGTVLYVEDEESDLLFMQMAFEKAGLGETFRAVGNGREALAYLSGSGAYADRQRYPLPALLLLDLNLPLISGFEVLKWLRSRPEFQALPVVVFSSSLHEADKLQARELGANDYVEKPKSGLQFGEVVERLRQGWLK